MFFLENEIGLKSVCGSCSENEWLNKLNQTFTLMRRLVVLVTSCERDFFSVLTCIPGTTQFELSFELRDHTNYCIKNFGKSNEILKIFSYFMALNCL